MSSIFLLLYLKWVAAVFGFSFVYLMPYLLSAFFPQGTLPLQEYPQRLVAVSGFSFMCLMPCLLSAFFFQGTLPLQEYLKRLAAVFGFFYAFIGGPISYQTFDPFSQVRLVAVVLAQIPTSLQSNFVWLLLCLHRWPHQHQTYNPFSQVRLVVVLARIPNFQSAFVWLLLFLHRWPHQLPGLRPLLTGALSNCYLNTNFNMLSI